MEEVTSDLGAPGGGEGGGEGVVMLAQEIAERSGTAVLSAWVNSMEGVGRMSVLGVSQMAADAGYMKNVYKALGLKEEDGVMLEDAARMGGGNSEDFVKGKEGRIKRMVGKAKGIVGGGDGLS
jgi:hypothetical protein